MPKKLSSVTLDVANHFLLMATKVAQGTVSGADQFEGAVGAVVVKNGDTLGEGQAHIKNGDVLNANCKASAKAEQRAIMAAMANTDEETLKGSMIYLSHLNAEGNPVGLERDDFLENASQTSKKAGVVGWVLNYEGSHVYMFSRRELFR